jgi:predicted membrane channel-forming protein YqfA (hemolysin III family)
MPDDDQARELKFHLWGWIFFLIGCVIFIVSSIRDGDVLGLVGSVLFLVGCVVFMIP